MALNGTPNKIHFIGAFKASPIVPGQDDDPFEHDGQGNGGNDETWWRIAKVGTWIFIGGMICYGLIKSAHIVGENINQGLSNFGKNSIFKWPEWPEWPGKPDSSQIHVLPEDSFWSPGLADSN